MEVASKKVISHLFASQKSETFSFTACWLRWIQPHYHVFVNLIRSQCWSLNLTAQSTKAALCRWYSRFFIMFWHALSFSWWLCLLAFPIFVGVVSGCICVCVVGASLQILITYWPLSCQCTGGHPGIHPARGWAFNTSWHLHWQTIRPLQ